MVRQQGLKDYKGNNETHNPYEKLNFDFLIGLDGVLFFRTLSVMDDSGDKKLSKDELK